METLPNTAPACNGWRKHPDHKSETKAVKKALTDEGLHVLKVGHGRGTGWGWLEVEVGIPVQLHLVAVNGIVHAMTSTAKYLMPYIPSCTPTCPACELYRRTNARALQIIAEVTGRRGDYDGDVLVEVREVPAGKAVDNGQ